MKNDGGLVQMKSQMSLVGVAGFLLRLIGLLVPILAFYGCSTPQPFALPSSPKTQTSPVATSSEPNGLDGIRSDAAEQTIHSAPGENNLFFSLCSTIVDEAGREKLRAIAERLLSNPQEKVSLVGYNDDQGSRSYNLAITGERLLAVEKTLKSYRVPARQIRRKRIGGLKTTAQCRSSECKKQTGRVELVFSR